MKHLLAIAFFVPLATWPLAACTVGPNYTDPMPATPAAYQALPQPGETPFSTPVAGAADLSRWWEQFKDPELNSLVTRALTANTDLMEAASRIRQARQQDIVQGAAALPAINGTGAAVGLHSNSNPLAGLSGGGGQGGSGMGQSSGGSSATNLQFYSAGFDATWEIDAFGGVRRAVEAAKANDEAALWAMRDGEVSLSAEVANDYLTLRSTQARIALIVAERQRQSDTLDIVKARAVTGFVTQLDVNQAATQVSTTSAQLPPLQAQATAMIHALAVLLGQPPEAMMDELKAAAALPVVPQTLPVGLPSDLLRRRPDVREAERKLAAATANVGVATAQLYPRFNLIALTALASPSLSKLFSTDSFTGAGVGMITWPIFSAGKGDANVAISDEQRQQAYLAYQQSVLKALQDAEDALARYAAEQERLESLQQSVATENVSFTIAQQQYNSGLVTYLDVLTAQTTLLNLQDQANQSRAALAEDLVSLYKALGGGWSA